jgi:class 3 adenylate cyclase
MEPEIRYTRTTDGVNIAYWTLGSGRPLVYLPPTAQHVQLDWRHRPTRDLYTYLASNHLFVRFDERGRGLSQRDDVEFSAESELLDFEAVVAKVGFSEFDVIAIGGSVSSAIYYAARHPERVRKIALVNPYAPMPEVLSAPRGRALAASLAIDYGVFTEMFAYMAEGWQSGADARQYAALLRDSMTQDEALRWYARFNGEYIEAFERSLSNVQSPTLIVYQGEAVIVPSSSPERLAAGLHDARLLRLEGNSVTATSDPLMLAAVEDFLLSDDARRAPATLPAGMAVILFVDIESSTLLTERMGDTAFRTASRAIDEQVRSAVQKAGGTSVEGKVMGDGVMSVFSSAAQAIAAAESCSELGAASELGLHIGLHAGDVIREGDNVYGGAVNIASRICDASTPGEILVSATVRDLARTSAGVSFEDRGERTLKGIEDPVRIFAVR